MIKEKLHPKHFLAYQYEGNNTIDRQRLADRKYYMRIYLKDYLFEDQSASKEN
ncbi:MAG: hypothetical protein HQL27_04565 [Candidatus Omnitrophica bacterium]|nr:hypothetical protein [Candidatus Omnitrophota bacterium]